MKSTILTVFCAITVWGGCNRPSSTQAVDSTHGVDSTHAVDSTLTVEKLLANPQGHAHVVFKVRGCVYRGFEILVLYPCDSPNLAPSIWLDDAETQYAFAKFNLLHPESKVPITELRFRFDRSRNSRAWKKLNALLENNITSEIVLLGQFETGSGFGHMGAYPHELILVDVLDNKSNPTP